MKKTTSIIVPSILLIGILSGCVSNPSAHIDPEIRAQAPQLIIASQPVGDGYYALIEKINGRWKVVSIQDTPFYVRDNDEQEILFVNRGLRSIAPSFDPRMRTGEGATCTPMAFMRERNLYWLCKSYFSSIRVGMTVGGNIVSCALTFCLAAGTKEELDRDKIQEVVIESDLINIAKKRIADEDHNAQAIKLISASFSNLASQTRKAQDASIRRLKGLQDEISAKPRH